jgi:hypothetical protein
LITPTFLGCGPAALGSSVVVFCIFTAMAG